MNEVRLPTNQFPPFMAGTEPQYRLGDTVWVIVAGKAVRTKVLEIHFVARGANHESTDLFSWTDGYRTEYCSEGATGVFSPCEVYDSQRKAEESIEKHEEGASK